MEQWEWKTLSNSTGILESFLFGLIIWLLFFVFNIFFKMNVDIFLISFFTKLLVPVVMIAKGKKATN